MAYRDKKVALLGFGVENQAVVAYLERREAILTVCDKNPSLPKISSISDYRLGPGYLKNLIDFDIIFRSPGIPFLTPEIQEALQSGVSVTSSTKLFFDECPAKIIGITGTKGKSTTASFLYQVLESAKAASEIRGKVYLVGNIGTPAVSILDQVEEPDLVVFELSSFQLQDLDCSPHIAVVLNISEDHLNHHRDIKEYTESKKNIVKYQTENDYAVLDLRTETGQNFAALTKARVANYAKVHLPENNLPWLYLGNLAAAAAAASLVGATEQSITRGVADFKTLPHRLEHVGEIRGVLFYDDSKATTPDSTIGALKSFKRPITLIVGGSAKGNDFGKLAEEIKESKVKRVIFIGTEGSRLAKLLQEIKAPQKLVSGGNSMREIVKTALTLSHPGDVVLLSPAAASFDMFKNAEDRGNQFKKEFRKKKLFGWLIS